MSLPSAAAVLPDATVLFNDPRYHALHAPPEARSLVVSHHDEDGRLVGALAGVLDDGVLTSGYSAPFGGVGLVRGDETPGRITSLVDDVVAQLDGHDVAQTVVRCAPRCHLAAEDAVRFALLNAGFAVAEADLSFTLDLAPYESAAAWLAARKKPLRRAHREAEADRLAFGDAEDWETAFSVLVANRAARGRTLSIDLPRVRAVREEFGDAIRLAELREGDAPPVAAALTYRVTTRTELVVAWGDAPDLDRSPMPVLVERLVDRALTEGLDALDLGTSTLPAGGAGGSRRVPNDGLVQFKRALGAIAELRPVLQRRRP